MIIIYKYDCPFKLKTDGEGNNIEEIQTKKNHNNYPLKQVHLKKENYKNEHQESKFYYNIRYISSTVTHKTVPKYLEDLESSDMGIILTFSRRYSDVVKKCSSQQSKTLQRLRQFYREKN